jgi:hypothetical protein
MMVINEQIDKNSHFISAMSGVLNLESFSSRAQHYIPNNFHWQSATAARMLLIALNALRHVF